MEGKEKYYTPSIEEFHVGFEYEADSIYIDVDKAPSGWSTQSLIEYGYNHTDAPFVIELGWGPRTYEYSYNIEYALEKGRIRVKHLDREDIESLGFLHENGRVYRLHNTNFSLWHNFSRVTPSSSVTIRRKEGDLLLDVAISPVKNKSELKRLLKQLDIL